MRKLTKSQLNERASKDAKKDAKKYEKEGWTVSPGALPLVKQLDRSYNMQMEFNEDLTPKYIVANAQSIGENYDGAKMQAMELAKQELAGKIQTEITALVENTVANKQLAAEEAASMVQTVSASKNSISQKIGRVLTVVECYRSAQNKNKEVLVYIAYDINNAFRDAKQVIREELEKKGENLQGQLDKFLGL